jgi:hypothetical protein
LKNPPDRTKNIPAGYTSGELEVVEGWDGFKRKYSTWLISGGVNYK